MRARPDHHRDTHDSIHDIAATDQSLESTKTQLTEPRPSASPKLPRALADNARELHDIMTALRIGVEIMEVGMDEGKSTELLASMRLGLDRGFTILRRLLEPVD